MYDQCVQQLCITCEMPGKIDVRDSKAMDNLALRSTMQWPCVCITDVFVFITVQHYWVTFCIIWFYRASACCMRDIDITPPSFCPANAGFVPKLLHILWNFYTNLRCKLPRREACYYGVCHYFGRGSPTYDYTVWLSATKFAVVTNVGNMRVLRSNMPLQLKQGMGQPPPPQKNKMTYVNTVCCNATKLFNVIKLS